MSDYAPKIPPVQPATVCVRLDGLADKIAERIRSGWDPDDIAASVIALLQSFGGAVMTDEQCICAETGVCPETDNSCPVCVDLDPYDPCPVVGFGCGLGGGPLCDCCTDEQRKATVR